MRKVDAAGQISFRNRVVRVGKAFRYQPVALRSSEQQNGLWEIYFCHHPITQIDLRSDNQAKP